MPDVHPLDAARFGEGTGDVSAFVAPPYDVLDADDKAALLATEPRNVVAIDLPHCPPKELGPPSSYSNAARTYNAWLGDGTLARSGTPAMYAYRQTFTFMGQEYKRCGMTCSVETVPFGPRSGGGILAHEETFSGPKEDRFALMRATKAQLSPIFGLHADQDGRATSIVHTIMGARDADQRAVIDGILHEVWTITDDAALAAYRDALVGEDIFIADGHHRYTTALNYLASLGDVPADHAARRCMMVLVGMSDPGLAIGPTHRVLGGMRDYSLDAFLSASAGVLVVEEHSGDLSSLDKTLNQIPYDRCAFGLYDVQTERTLLAAPKDPDPLVKRFSSKPEAWRKLDVALIQYLIVEEICRPKLNGGDAVTWAFPHAVEEIEEIASGAETGAGGGAGFAQLAVLVRPTPLDAVREISQANELMPQKSTFFYPKLATGLFINPLE